MGGQEQTAAEGGRRAPARGLVAALLFAGLFALYTGNSPFLPGNDAKGTLYLLENLYRHGRLDFDPAEFPFMFAWRLSEKGREHQVAVPSWEDPRLAQAMLEGRLTVRGSKYYLSQDLSGRYVSTFGPACALLMYPAYRLVRPLLPDPLEQPGWIWLFGKVFASFLCALATVFVFLTFASRVQTAWALSAALLFGCGSLVLSVLSQSAWQQTFSAFFLAVGLFCMLSPNLLLASGGTALALALGAACRPTLLAGVLFFSLPLWRRPRLLLLYALGAAAPLALVALYNHQHFGSPWLFAQGLASMKIAMQKTSEATLWSASPLQSLPGLLLGPSRGLFVFSPAFLALLPAAGIMLLGRREYGFLLPVLLTMAAMATAAFLWFDWWGGWCFGYRPLADCLPLLTVLLLPFFSRWNPRSVPGLVFLLLLLASVTINLGGAALYNPRSWNGLALYQLDDGSGTTRELEADDPQTAALLKAGARVVAQRNLDIDRPENRQRLWSLGDSQLLHMFSQPARAVAMKKALLDEWLQHPEL